MNKGSVRSEDRKEFEDGHSESDASASPLKRYIINKIIRDSDFNDLNQNQNASDNSIKNIKPIKQKYGIEFKKCTSLKEEISVLLKEAAKRRKNTLDENLLLCSDNCAIERITNFIGNGNLNGNKLSIQNENFVTMCDILPGN